MKKNTLFFYTPKDIHFKYDELKSLFYKNRKMLNVHYEFEFLLINTHLFCFEKDNELFGAIYLFNDLILEQELRKEFLIDSSERMLFLNGFSKRKMYTSNLLAMKTVLKLYNCEIYAFATNRAANYCLLKLNFEKIKKKEDLERDKFYSPNLYKYKEKSRKEKKHG